VFTPSKPTQFTLSNGVSVFYCEDRELPLVSLRGILRCGSLYEPPDKAGLASLTGVVMRTGGTKTVTGDALDEELEFLSASVESSIGQEYANVSASCLKKDLKRVLDIYTDVMMNPEFRQEKIDLAKNQAREAIRRRWDMPGAVSGLLFTEQLLGGTPYGARTTYKSLGAVTRDDLTAFHNRYFAPNNLYLGVVGDLSAEEAKSLLEEAFRGWKKKDVALPEIPALVEKADGGVYYAYRDTPQANVVLGHLGVRHNNPDQAALEVMNDILGGGGFTSRLMKEIRSNRGLTYGIYGGVFSGKDRGLFRIGSPLKAERCLEALGAVKDIVVDLQTNLVTDEEIDTAKKSLINSFVFRFESKAGLVFQYMSYKLDGYPDDYLDKYVGRIKNITKADVQAAAKKYMAPARMILVVVGDEKKFDKPLAEFGKVQPIDYRKIAEAEKSEQ
jgi:predicted Zn-dependent peptidase